jgi:serine/threonine protein kinase
MKQAVATCEPHGAAVTNLPLTEPGNAREARGPGGRFLYPSGSRPLEGYTIKRGIGRGGFGEVYFANSDGGKEVALKLIRRNLDVELRGVAHCINLKHPNLLALYDIRRDANDDTWVVMEYVGGETLDQVIARNPNGMPEGEVLTWLHGIAAGVGYLHDHGIVHRDLKPGNIFCDEGIVKLGDYGLSKFISASRRSGQTESVGTVHYMAPEVANGRYGKEIDIYALGVILYEMLSGHVPFEGESVGEVLMKHLTAKADLSGIKEPYRGLLERILDKDPARRPQTVAEVLAALPKPPGEQPVFATRSLGAGAMPPPLPRSSLAPADVFSTESEEPVWKAVKQNWRDLREAWNQADLNPFLRAVILILVGILVISTHPIWVTAIMIYAVYRIVRTIVISSGKTSVALPDQAAQPAGAPSPAPPMAPAPTSSGQPPGRSMGLETPVAVLPIKAPRDKLTELLTSMLLAALFALVTCFVIDKIFALDPGQIAWLTAVSATGAWAVMIPAKFWEGTRDDEAQRRFVLLIVGLLLGFYAWSLDRLLLVNLPYSTNPHLRNQALHVPNGVSGARPLFEADGSPTLVGYLAYFGFLFPVMRWWRLADPLRRRRLRLWTTALYGAWAWLLTLFWPFPEFGVAAATTMALVVQLASPWTDHSARRRVHLGGGT